MNVEDNADKDLREEFLSANFRSLRDDHNATISYISLDLHLLPEPPTFWQKIRYPRRFQHKTVQLDMFWREIGIPKDGVYPLVQALHLYNEIFCQGHGLPDDISIIVRGWSRNNARQSEKNSRKESLTDR